MSAANVRGLALFDFDKTLSDRDSLFDFHCWHFGKFRVYTWALRHGMALAGCPLKWSDRGKVKETFLSYFWKGVPYEEFAEAARKYSLEYMPRILRSEALQALKEHRERGDRILIVSASLKEWLEPWGLSNEVDMILGTEMEVREGILTGKLRYPQLPGGREDSAAPGSVGSRGVFSHLRLRRQRRGSGDVGPGGCPRLSVAKKPMTLRDLAELYRFPQWAKNLFVLAPAFFAFRLNDPRTLLHALEGFLAFSLVASGGYVLNDLRDLESDRRHPEKRFRSLASGRISSSAGITAGGFALLGGLLIGAFLGVETFGVAFLLRGAQRALFLETQTSGPDGHPLRRPGLRASGAFRRRGGGGASLPVDRDHDLSFGPFPGPRETPGGCAPGGGNLRTPFLPGGIFRALRGCRHDDHRGGDPGGVSHVLPFSGGYGGFSAPPGCTIPSFSYSSESCGISRTFWFSVGPALRKFSTGTAVSKPSWPDG